MTTLANKIEAWIEAEGFSLKDFFLTQRRPPVWIWKNKAARARWQYRERRRRRIAQFMARQGISVHDLKAPTPTAEQTFPTFIARFTNGHETCTGVFCPPDKLNVAQGVMLARRAFVRLMGIPPEHEIVSARFEFQGRVLANYSATDLAVSQELLTDVGAVGEMNASAPTGENDMDVSKYLGSQYLKVANMPKDGFKAKIVAITPNTKFDKVELVLSEGSTLLLNMTNVQTLARAYGCESDDWVDREIGLFVGETEYKDEMVPTILIEPISDGPKNKKAATPQPKKKPPPDMDDEIPFK
jgi:hypothetical protein